MIILMGCFGLHSEDLPRTFIDRGASVVIGWDGLVDLQHTDETTLVLRMMLLESADIDESITATKNKVGHDPSGSVLSYYPIDRGGVEVAVHRSILCSHLSQALQQLQREMDLHCYHGRFILRKIEIDPISLDGLLRGVNDTFTDR